MSILNNPHLNGLDAHGEVVPGITKLWDETLGDPSVCIAILDGPVDLRHPCLVGANLKQIQTLVPNSVDNGPASQHGTFIASVIFGGHGEALRGIAPNCSGLIVPIFHNGTSGHDELGGLVACSQLDLARAILLAAENGADVINISGGQFAPSGTAHPLLESAVQYCSENNILIVAAAGNDGCDCMHVPASVASVLAVGAMSNDGKPSDFSNWGERYRDNGILAPGENIRGAKLGGGFVSMTGTSSAAAFVSGVAGLLLSLQLRMGGKVDVSAVRSALLQGAVNCMEKPVADCRLILAGRVNIERTMILVKQGIHTMSEPMVSEFDSPNSSNTASPVGAAPSGCGAPAARVREEVFEATSGIEAPVVRPSSCACEGGGSTQLVFALGSLSFDFGTEARRDSIIQHMSGDNPNPYDHRELLDYLSDNPWDAASIIWTLNLDATAIYAIKPSGPFALDAYVRLREFLLSQCTENVERVSIPGVVSGKTTLMTGQVVPTIIPNLRGMYSWTTDALVKGVAGNPPPAESDQMLKDHFAKKISRVRDFLERVYFEIRNLGVASQERAINFAATNAFNINKIYEAAINEELDLDCIEVERSPICRPQSDCWDVKLIFFFPQRQVQSVRKVYRFTVDVSDVVPVTVGTVRSWFIR